MAIAGIDIGGTTVKIGIFEENKGIVLKDERPSPIGNPFLMVDMIADMLKKHKVTCAGVGTAGSVDIDTKLVCAGNLDWRYVPLEKLLVERLEMPVWVDNDAQAALMAEWYDGACKGIDCAVYLTLGTGIGGGIILDGKPWRGKRNIAAEFGHMVTHGDGLLCSCTRRGCFEMYASASALERMAQGKSSKEVIEQAKSGDNKALELFNAYVHELCIGFAGLIMIFDPDVIVLGGGMSRAGTFLIEQCEKELIAMFENRLDEIHCQIKLAKHSNDAGIIGAAILARENLMNR